MTFIAGIIIGLFIGAWVGGLAVCLCRVSASTKNVTEGGKVRAPKPSMTACPFMFNGSLTGRRL